MYLIYTDETGTSNHQNTPFTLYGGLVVHESNVLKFEMQIAEIVQEFLGVGNMLEAEIHFTEIFNYIFYSKKPSKPNQLKLFEENILPTIKNKSKNDVINFVTELFQLISKANIPLLFCTIDKRDKYHEKHHLGYAEISYNAYAFKGFLNLVDRFLTQKNEMGLLVADDFFNQIPKKIKRLSIAKLISDETIKKYPHIKEIVYKRVLVESLIWKNRFFENSIAKKSIAPLKYKFQSHSFNILDNINFVSSKESMINQISDVLLYVIRKLKEYELNRSRYNELKEFYENKDLIESIDFLYSTGSIVEDRIDNNDLDIIFLIDSYNEI